jgi:hypothetical protein
MGGRAILGVLLGVVLVAVVVSFARCLPKPEEKIEWLRREDAIIVQMRSFGGDSMIASVDRAPSFTLYGNGTLIVSEEAQDCGTVSDPCSATRLLQSRLSDHDIQGLLDFIDGTGFLDFRYEQPVPPVSGSATAYIYMSTRMAANAVRAYALGWEPQDGAEWSEFRKLNTIVQKLQDLREKAFETSTPFPPKEGELKIVPLVANDLIGVPEWRFPQFDIAAVAPSTSDGHLRLSPDELALLELTDASAAHCWCSVQQSGRLFNVIYRPVLPYEEHFPEFEAPQ